MYFIAAGKLDVRHYLEKLPTATCTVTLKEHLEATQHKVEQQEQSLSAQELYNRISSAGQWRKVKKSDGHRGSAGGNASTGSSNAGRPVLKVPGFVCIGPAFVTLVY
jgi:hypothetical protein